MPTPGIYACKESIQGLKTMPVADFNPLDLTNTDAYQQWREWKLADYPVSVNAMMVPVDNPAQLTAGEQAALLGSCRKTNMGFYSVIDRRPVDKQAIKALGLQFGLKTLDKNLRADEDSITSLRVVENMPGTHYIPYTNKPLNWHTDGYYNRLDEQVRGIVMHCVEGAGSGGENGFLDPEIACLLLRDENPDYVAALKHPEAMTIPENVEDGVELRKRQAGPVFSIEKATGRLHMRYTARTRSIVWRDDHNTRMAVGFLSELLGSDSPYILRHGMSAGQGIICNNVLHSRTAFTDGSQPGQKRLLYRARYHERIAGT